MTGKNHFTLVLYVFLMMLVLMTAYEIIKQLLFPEIAIWESHLITIIFSSVSAAVAAFYIYKRQQELMRKLYDKERETQHLNVELQNTIKNLENTKQEVNTLSKLLPISASCKKIRDDEGYWSQIDSYLATHSGVFFSHSLCPDCVKKIYPDMDY